MTEKTEIRGFVRNCLIASRGEVLFTQREDGAVVATLDGYAIIPKEDYRTSLGTPILREGESVWPCPKCGGMPTPEGHDPCIANLPGVIHACCGHGKTAGYAMFEDGRIIWGDFRSSCDGEEGNEHGS